MSSILGFALGFEREITGKFAGLRTHILVCLGSTLFTILSLYGFRFFLQDGLNGINDPARIAAQIIAGIGFIGAGTVMRQGVTVSGITTAATLWMSAAVGMACGCGMYQIAIVAVSITLIVLIAIRHFEKKVLTDKYVASRDVTISFSCKVDDYPRVEKIIYEHFKFVTGLKKKIQKGDVFSVKLHVNTRKKIAKINELFSSGENFSAFEIQENA